MESNPCIAIILEEGGEHIMAMAASVSSADGQRHSVTVSR